MKTLHPFRLVLGLFKSGGDIAIGQVPVAADWEPAVEAARLRAYRHLGLNTIGTDAVVEFRPVWQPKLGEPYISAMEAVLTAPGAGEVSCHVPTTFFKSLATAASASFVNQGLLKSGERVEYLVMAFPNSAPASQAASARFSVEEVPVPLAVQAAPLSEFLSRSAECDEQDPHDIPVFIPQAILDEADAITRQSPSVEVAAVLIGHVHRNAEGRELFLQVTAQVPARNSRGTSVKVTFGPETYQAVEMAIALRNAGEQWLGWMHSHPASAWCNAGCSAGARAQCPLQKVFFSADDCDVHRTLFPRAHSIALLVTNTDAGLIHALFSWRNGVIVQRGYHILDALSNPQPSAAKPVAAIVGDQKNENPCSS